MAVTFKIKKSKNERALELAEGILLKVIELKKEAIGIDKIKVTKLESSLKVLCRHLDARVQKEG